MFQQLQMPISQRGRTLAQENTHTPLPEPFTTVACPDNKEASSPVDRYTTARHMPQCSDPFPSDMPVEQRHRWSNTQHRRTCVNKLTKTPP